MRVNLDRYTLLERVAQTQITFLPVGVWEQVAKTFPPVAVAPYARPIYTFWLAFSKGGEFTRLTGIQSFAVTRLIEGATNPDMFDLFRLWYAADRVGKPAREFAEFFLRTLVVLLGSWSGAETFFRQAIWELCYRCVLGYMKELTPVEQRWRVHEEIYQKEHTEWVLEIAGRVKQALTVALQAYAIETGESLPIARWVDQTEFLGVWVGSVLRAVFNAVQTGSIDKEWALYPPRDGVTAYGDWVGTDDNHHRAARLATHYGAIHRHLVLGFDPKPELDPAAPVRRGRGRPKGAKNRVNKKKPFQMPEI